MFGVLVARFEQSLGKQPVVVNGSFLYNIFHDPVL
jgi:hypothetical protein